MSFAKRFRSRVGSFRKSTWATYGATNTGLCRCADRVSRVRVYLVCVILNSGCGQVCVRAKTENQYDIILRPASSRLVTEISGKTGRDKPRKSFVYVARRHPHERRSAFYFWVAFLYAHQSRYRRYICGSISFFRSITKRCNNLACPTCCNLTRILWLPLSTARASSS